MTTVQQLSVYSQTAQAAYADNLVPNASNTNAYQNPGAGMSAFQASQFDATWSVLQQSAPNESGFSAVLFQNRLTGEKVLAIRCPDNLAGSIARKAMSDIQFKRRVDLCAA